MANTYIQVYLQYVFAVQGRQNLIRQENEDTVLSHIPGPI